MSRIRSTDVVVAVLTLGLTLLLASGYLVDALGRTYSAFGSRSADLPAITRVAMNGWFRGSVTALVALAAAAAGWTRRPTWLTAAFLLASAGMGFSYYALYAPVWEMARAIR